MRYPGKLPASKRVGEMARIIDVMPTMLDVLQLPATGAQGSSLLPLLSGSKRDVLSLAEVIKGNEKNNPNQRALYEGDWKLLETEQPLGYQLFRYREDPGELNDLAAKHPDVVEAMRAKLGSLSQQNAALAEKIATRTHEYDAADLRNLGALGYIDDGDDDEPESQPATQPASRPAATAPSRPTAP
jgi:arylsulfatase A-like enzyme